MNPQGVSCVEGTSLESCCPSHETVFAELAKIAPGAPFLALGQTAFWDEPMKAGVALQSQALGYARKFVAGVHDTDYFAKHGGGRRDGKYAVLPHNDTSTKDLWSAAGEFSALFGSETVVRREALVKAGVKLGKVLRERPTALDQFTEAWGWRGVVFNGDNSSVVAETSFPPLERTLLEALDWAIDETLARVPKCNADRAQSMADALRSLVCSASNEGSLGEYYRSLLSAMYEFVSQEPVGLEATSTTELLQFNTETCYQTRFELVDRFLRPASRAQFVEAYNQALQGSEIYTLDRFGSWALPFDLVIPGHGRGTIRVAPRAIIVMTPHPIFITTKKPVQSIQGLAEAIERRFGKECTLVGKAVTLIGMLAAEFIFVFHEGASRYVKYSRLFHQSVNDSALHLNPILRVKYKTWDAMKDCQQWLTLPTPLRRPFGADELGSQSFAARWRLVREQQEQLLVRLSELHRPIEFVEYLATLLSPSWSYPAQRYREMHDRLLELHREINRIKERKAEIRVQWRAAAEKRNLMQHDKGQHWRAELFGKNPTETALRQRTEFESQIAVLDRDLREYRARWRALDMEQQAMVRQPNILAAHQERRELELEMELMRLSLVHEAVTASQGLSHAGYRPSAWWFPIICPDGGWFRQVARSAEYYLEPLV